MHMQDIRSIAKEHGLKTGKQTKVELVRHIQQAEGNFSCFATASAGICDQDDCLWREDCFTLAQKKSN
jgi:hypothetical protein